MKSLGPNLLMQKRRRGVSEQKENSRPSPIARDLGSGVDLPWAPLGSVPDICALGCNQSCGFLEQNPMASLGQGKPQGHCEVSRSILLGWTRQENRKSRAWAGRCVGQRHQPGRGLGFTQWALKQAQCCSKERGWGSSEVLRGTQGSVLPPHS